MPSCPFILADAGDFTETHGLARFEEPYLILEFQTKDVFTGTIYESDLSVVQIPIGDIAGMRVKRGMFGGTRITIRTHSAQPLRELPGNKLGEVTLKVRRRDQRVADEFADVLDYYLSHPELGWEDQPDDLPST